MSEPNASSSEGANKPKRRYNHHRRRVSHFETILTVAEKAYVTRQDLKI